MEMVRRRFRRRKIGNGGLELKSGTVKELNTVVESSAFKAVGIPELPLKLDAVRLRQPDLADGKIHGSGDDFRESFRPEIREGGESGDAEVWIESAFAMGMGNLEMLVEIEMEM